LNIYEKRSLERGDRNDPYEFYSTEITTTIKNYCRCNEMSVLDFGCGEQPFRKLFNDLSCEYMSYDLQQNESSSVTFLMTSEIPENHFDLVIVSDVLEHCWNLNDTLQTIFKTLKVGGYVIVSMPFLYREHEIPNDYWRLTSYNQMQLFDKFGKVEEFIKVGSPLDVAQTSLNEGLSAVSFTGRIMKYIAIKFLNFMKKNNLYEYSTDTYFSSITVVRK
jgi:SAM-dependent methyltransferase